MTESEFDVVIVGAGVSGALAANSLSQRGFRVLVLEAGPEFRNIDEHVDRFYAADAKTPGAPWPGKSPSNDAQNEFAPRPTVLDMGIKATFKDSNWYMLQTGKYPFNSTYERLSGGTSNHWLGTCLRHVPRDFRLQSAYGARAEDTPEGRELRKFGRDWLISYDDLEEWYLEAERVIGVAGDSEFYEDYHDAKRSAPYPMDRIPLSYLDQRLGERLDNQAVNGEEIQVSSTPQGRNSRDYPTRGDTERFGLYGEGRFLRYRCLGNTSCIPICPVGAKWDANAALREATSSIAEPRFPHKTAAQVRYKSVAYSVSADHKDRISQIRYRDYSDPDDVKDGVATGRVYILAAHAIETPKLLLMSPWKEVAGEPVTVANSSGMVGQHLMDHVIHLSWGLADEPLHPFRGPLSTSGIGEFRDSDARNGRAAYRIEIGNDGWSWPSLAPQKTVWQILNLDNLEGLPAGADAGLDLIRAFYKRDSVRAERGDRNPKWYGKELRQAVGDVVTRQIRIAAEPEALPLPDSYVTLPDKPWSVDQNNVDRLGLPKPQIRYVVSEYTKKGFVEGASTLCQIFQKLGVTEIATTLLGLDLAAAVFEYGDKEYEFGGAGHIAGTYLMGKKPDGIQDNKKFWGVVDENCRTHDHENLFLLGSGMFPALGTANPTLTIAALALRAADLIGRELAQGPD